MAFHNTSGRKIGRNEPCPCSSGKKFKNCHGRLDVQNSLEDPAIQEQIYQAITQKIQKVRDFENSHGKGKPIISTEYQDLRVVAVGDELHFGKKEKTRYFPDFLSNYVRSKLGTDWGNNELSKPLEERHQVLKWYDSMCHQQGRQKPELDGTYKTKANGAMLAYNRLAYDLYLIKHNAELQDKILQRLRNKQQFQGARFELCATASMISAGYDIEFEDESDTARKHTEFVATHSSGIKIAVEAKSRHRDGVLDYRASPRRTSNTGQALRVSVEGLIRKALTKEPDMPYFIFIEVNLPYDDEVLKGSPWFREMVETVESLFKEWGPGQFPANAVFFCNDPTYQEPERVPPGHSFWCYEVPVVEARYPLTVEISTVEVAQAIIRRTNIPNEYPSN